MRAFFIMLLMMPVMFYSLGGPVVAEDVMDQTIFCYDIRGNEKTGPDRPAICDDLLRNQTAKDNVLVGPNGIITKTTQALVYISGVLAMIMLIIAGYMYVFSSGNADSTSRARSTMIYAIVGLVVAVVAQLIVLFVLGRL